MKFVKMRIAADIATKCYDFVLFKHFKIVAYFLIPLSFQSFCAYLYRLDQSNSKVLGVIFIVQHFILFGSVVPIMSYLLDIFSGKKVALFTCERFGLTSVGTYFGIFRKGGIVNHYKGTGPFLIVTFFMLLFTFSMFIAIPSITKQISSWWRYIAIILYAFMLLLLAIIIIRKKSFLDSFKAFIAVIPKVWLGLIVGSLMVVLPVIILAFLAAGLVLLAALNISGMTLYLLYFLYFCIPLITFIAASLIAAMVTFVTAIAAYTQGHPIAKELDLFGLKKYQD